ncbi:MAG: hypothetical protein IH606_20460 [Burkholderiales bacterium]|nr:hypothetical protein [Burkholderiales bacterium]
MKGEVMKAQSLNPRGVAVADKGFCASAHFPFVPNVLFPAGPDEGT